MWVGGLDTYVSAVLEAGEDKAFLLGELDSTICFLGRPCKGLVDYYWCGESAVILLQLI